jgi:hypothetical protein
MTEEELLLINLSTINYRDIPEIKMSDAKILINKKIITPLLELELLKLQKFHFQYRLLHIPQDGLENLWNLYKSDNHT